MIDHVTLRNDLRRDEGVRRFPYHDTAGKLTIGCGRNLTDNGLSDDEADYLLDNDINRTIKELCLSFEWFGFLSPNRKLAIINMAFNMGVPKLGGFKKMIRAIESGHYKRAALEALDSRWAKQVGNRALRISRMIEEG